jgi:hypothetical protein
MGAADTMTMAQMLDKDDEDAAIKLLTQAAGKIRLLGVCRKPDGGYDPGAGFFDSDVETVLTAANIFCLNQLARLEPVRVLIEGRITDEESLDVFEPKTAAVGFAGVVVGGSLADGSASVGTALGRAVLFGAHVKIGKVANGPLAISQVYIGTKLLKDYTGLDALHGSGVISFMQHHNKAGFYFGIDRMASTDDYRLLAYGRIVDKAAIIAEAVYIENLEDDVDLNADGTLQEIEIEHLKGVLKQTIESKMGSQISAVEVLIDPKQVMVPDNKLKVKIRILPKGYTSYIDIDLGLTAQTV